MADMDGDIGLPGLEVVERQLEDVIPVLRAEQERRAAGSVVRRPAWKNLVFSGGPGTGKSRTAISVGRTYRDLGVLSSGHVIEMSAADLVGATAAETGALVTQAIKPAGGGILMINGAHVWRDLPERGEQVSRRLYEKLTEYRRELGDDLAVVLAGWAEPLRALLHANPPLAARFRAVIDFPGYSPDHLAAIFGTLAAEAGLMLTPPAGRKAAVVLAQAEGDHGSGNARLAVRLLDQVTAAHGRRVITESRRPDPGTLNAIIESDVPEHLYCGDLCSGGEDRPGQYL